MEDYTGSISVLGMLPVFLENQMEKKLEKEMETVVI